jgi:trimethylamine--corrinoid protein Co-methyltransferase
MRSGAPALGTPESIFGVFAGAQLARRYGLPFRGGGGLCSSNAVDAQAAAESSFMLWATVLAQTDVVLHAAGWLEGGLTASLEKFAFDVELLEQLQVQQRGIGFSDEEFAFDALKEVGPGGLWLAAEHTMLHFKEWQYISPLFITQDFTTWETMGAEETAARANRRWKVLLASYEDPGIDGAVDEELRAFMDRRKAEPPPDEEH